MWDEQFVTILRQHLPFMADDEQLTPDTSLRDLGLDSLGTVELLAALESAYDVRFVDDDLSMETFATPAVLWAALTRMAGTPA
jgi:acyl carrier protein